MVKKSTSTKGATLFEIRLRNLDHDVLVLKGNEQDAASALLTGTIVLSITESISVKKLSLKLYSNLSLKSDSINPRNGKPMNFHRTIYEHIWDSTEFTKYMTNVPTSMSMALSSSSGLLSRNSSSTSLKGLSSLRSKPLSATNLPALGSLTSNSSSTSLHQMATSASTNNLIKSGNHILTPGNYEIPFSAILPGSIPESIEGLPGCSNVYRLEAAIDRGKFHSSIVAKKRLRVIRTLTTDAVELSETMAVDNTWPQKVEYSLSCPMKAIAIGSGTPVSIMIVPLLKDLQLGDIKIQLVESYSYVGYFPPIHSGERIVCSKKIAKPDPDNLDLDKWEIETFLKVPGSLGKCTQDVDLLTHVKVKHKLKFNIGLINPDGHVSELRASLPVQLFISPFVAIRSTPDEESEEEQSDEVLFTNNDSSVSLATLNSNNSSHTSLTGLIAPPLYEKHIYDRLWSDVSPVETPVTSGTSTPRAIRSGNSSGSGTNSTGSDLHQFSMSPLDSNLLTENLRLLSLQRQKQEENNATTTTSTHTTSPPLRIPVAAHARDRATFNLEGDDYFTRRPAARSPLHQSLMNGGQASPILSPPMHLSRVPSETQMSPAVSTEDLLHIPSYTEAMKGEITEDLSPAYEPPLPGSNIDLASANKRFEDLQKRPPITPTYSSTPSRSGRSSGGSSPSPSQSRGSSLVNLAGYFSHARGGSSTNLSSLNDNSRNEVVGSKLSSGMADRATLVNYQNMSFRKKDKKTDTPISTSGTKNSRFKDLEYEEEQQLMGGTAPQSSIELKPMIPSIFDIAKDLDIHLAQIKNETTQLTSLYKKLIIIASANKSELESQIEQLNYSILSRFEKCYVSIKKFIYLNKNHEKLKLNYSKQDLEILVNFQQNYATQISEASIVFRNLQNNYMKFLRDEDDEELVENKEETTESIENYSKQVLKQEQQQLQNNPILEQREREISKLAMGILEVSTIFKEMETIVVHQGTILDRIDYNLQNTVADLQSADKELIKARHYQKRTTKCKIIFFLCLCVFALVMIVIVRPSSTTKIIEKPAPNTPEPERPVINKPEPEPQPEPKRPAINPEPNPEPNPIL
ncbi:Protein ROD1 [Spathaspora sp. JA1]|nr:Protein ROD1 [Spathaspora sp. JA1]